MVNVSPRPRARLDMTAFVAYCWSMADAALAIKNNVRAVLERIAEAARRSGRAPSEVFLMAAVKARAVAEIEAVVESGVHFLGENRIKEGEEHLAALYPEARSRCKARFIGRLQSNKARRALLAFDSLDSVDSPDLAKRLSRIADEEGIAREVMIEVNCGEKQKGGVSEKETPALAELLFELPNLTLTGLMAVPPQEEDPDATRLVFRRLKKLFDSIRANHPNLEAFGFLSIGMSNDYVVAIEEGATLVRVGTALFGPRRLP